MMGLQQSEAGLFSYRINLEQRVRKDHPLRRVAQAIDFGFVRQEVAHCYGRNGNRSEDPAVIMKMMFLLFFDDVPSARELMKLMAERLDYLWFVGYELDQKIPDHSVLSKARKRWGAEVFERLFVQTIRRCAEAGLIDGKKLHMDSTLVDADAANDSILQSGPELVAALRRCYHQAEAKLEPLEQAESFMPKQSAEPAAGKSGGKAGRKRPGSKQGQPKATTNATHVSTTDPEAALVRSRTLGARLRYKQHRAVDDAYGVITAVETTSGEVDEGSRLSGLLAQHQSYTGEKVETIVADSKYGIVENFIACQQAGIRTHMADLSAKQSGTGQKAGIYSEQDFIYDAQSDSYRCPAGQKLIRTKWQRKGDKSEYQASAQSCAQCALRPQCTRNKRARSLKRYAHHELLVRGRQQAASRAAKRDRRRRQQLMERSFADGANNHHLKRAHWRGLRWQAVQAHLIATCQNVRILLARTKRKPAAVAAMEAPVAFRVINGQNQAARALCQSHAAFRARLQHRRGVKLHLFRHTAAPQRLSTPTGLLWSINPPF